MLRGGRVVTFAADGGAEAVAVRGGRIAYVGASAGAQAHVGPGTEVIDLRGRTLLPGIHDAHLHPLSGGRLLATPTLDYRRLGKRELLAEIAGFLARDAGAEPGGWLVVELWDATAMDEQPAKEDLDALGTARPILVVSLDGHIALASSRALALGGVGAATPDPPGGVIVRDAGGEPTGILLDSALDLVARRVPEPTAEEDVAALRAAHEALARHGVTSYMDASAGRTELAAVAALSDAGGMLVRPSAAITVSPELAEDPAAMLAHLEALRAEFARPGVAIRTAKLFLDGVIEHPTQTAALLEPYLVDGGAGGWVAGPSRGPTYFPQPVADRAVAALDAAGWQVHVHAIGDRATRSALDAFAHARDRNGATGNRHTIAHLELVHPDDLPRFAALGVLADLQLQWARRDPYTVDNLAPHLGPDRWRDLYPAAALEAAGATLCGGSDWPVDPLAPFAQIATAVTRGAGDGEAPLFPGQALSLRSSLAMHTRGGAFQLFQEDLTGQIAVGRAADLVAVDGDLLAAPLARVAEAEVVLTMVDGAIVHRAGSAAG